MNWKKRLLDLTLAGGAASALAGCTGVPGIPACNANPDPCCSEPTSQACLDSKAQQEACTTAGGTYSIYQGCVAPDGAILIYPDGGLPNHDTERPDGGEPDGGHSDAGR